MSLPSRILLLSRRPISRVAVRDVQRRSLSTSTEDRMNTTQLADSVAAANDLTKVQAKKIVDSVFDTITQTVADKKKVVITGFGTFESATSKERQARNPSTGETITVPEKERVKFTASKVFKDKVNGV